MDILLELYRRLPHNGEWTEDKRRRWLKAVEASVDWLMSERRRRSKLQRAAEACEWGRVSFLEVEEAAHNAN